MCGATWRPRNARLPQAARHAAAASCCADALTQGCIARDAQRAALQRARAWPLTPVFAGQVVASGVVDKYIGESARVIREMFRWDRGRHAGSCRALTQPRWQSAHWRRQPREPMREARQCLLAGRRLVLRGLEHASQMFTS